MLENRLLPIRRLIGRILLMNMLIRLGPCFVPLDFVSIVILFAIVTSSSATFSYPVLSCNIRLFSTKNISSCLVFSKSVKKMWLKSPNEQHWYQLCREIINHVFLCFFQRFQALFSSFCLVV